MTMYDHPAARLDHLVALRLTGPDRAAVLQGQTSNDVRHMDATRSQLTTFNNPKGRCYAIATLAAWDDTHILITDRSVAELLCKRLRMYILRAKATVELATDLMIVGQPRARAAPPEDFASASTSAGLRINWPGSRELLIALATPELPPAATSDAWRLADIVAGIPTVVAETVEHFVPLWLGLERFGAIDYKKGCYTGQEIVARTHYLGTVKQRLWRARSPVSAHAGARVLGGGDQALGEVVSVAPAGTEFALLIAARNSEHYRLADSSSNLFDVHPFD